MSPLRRQPTQEAELVEIDQKKANRPILQKGDALPKRAWDGDEVWDIEAGCVYRFMNGRWLCFKGEVVDR